MSTLQSINRPFPRHEGIGNIGEYGGDKQECGTGQDRHDAHQVYFESREFARGIVAQKVIPTKVPQGPDASQPRVDQKEDKVLEIGCTNAVCGCCIIVEWQWQQAVVRNQAYSRQPIITISQ